MQSRVAVINYTDDVRVFAGCIACRRVRVRARLPSAEEALLDARAGADLLDAKEPYDGPRGAVSPETLRAIVAAVGGRRPVSATVGDLPLQVDPLRRAARLNADCGANFVKIGIFEQPFDLSTLRAVPPAVGGLPLIAVLFADRSPPLQVAD